MDGRFGLPERPDRWLMRHDWVRHLDEAMKRPREEQAGLADAEAADLPATPSRLASIGSELRIGALVLLAVVAGLLTWLLVRGDGETKTIEATGPAAVSAQDLAALPAKVHHPVYWAGPKPGFTYELTRTSDDRIYVRYLPAAISVGVHRPYLTIGTYPVRDAVAAVHRVAKRLRVKPVALSDGGVAVQDTEHPTSVFFAYPGVPYQVEVFDPSPARARGLVLSGRITALGPGSGPTRPSSAQPRSVTILQLRALERRLGHPVFWVGARQAVTYELTETSDGRIYVRYLPRGAKPGDQRPHTTVGTYPLPDAVEAVKAVAKKTDGRTLSVAGGGIAAVDPAHPTSVYIAFPGSDYQIEVFDPSAARALRLVSSGRVVSVR
jgi:hypothetical protein